MSSLKKELIKLGSTNPELRSNIRPILNSLGQGRTASQSLASVAPQEAKAIERLVSARNKVDFVTEMSVPQAEAEAPDSVDTFLQINEDIRAQLESAGKKIEKFLKAGIKDLAAQGIQLKMSRLTVRDAPMGRWPWVDDSLEVDVMVGAGVPGGVKGPMKVIISVNHDVTLTVKGGQGHVRGFGGEGNYTGAECWKALLVPYRGGREW